MLHSYQMGVVVVQEKLTKQDVVTARKDHDIYIKITIDIKQEITVLGGEYHADAKKVLVEKFNSKNSDIWGGGFSILKKEFRTDAMLNLKPNLENNSMEIINPEAREKFIQIAKRTLYNIEEFI